MRILDLVRDGTASMRLVAILAGGAVLWLVWLARHEGGFRIDRMLSGTHHLIPARRRDRRRADRPFTGSLDELNRLRRTGAI